MIYKMNQTDLLGVKTDKKPRLQNGLSHRIGIMLVSSSQTTLGKKQRVGEVIERDGRWNLVQMIRAEPVEWSRISTKGCPFLCVCMGKEMKTTCKA